MRNLTNLVDNLAKFSESLTTDGTANLLVSIDGVSVVGLFVICFLNSLVELCC